jgi:hypothetical protein
MKPAILILLTFISFQHSAFAQREGGGVGNGGNVYICSDRTDNPNYRERVILADFAEFEVLGMGHIQETIEPVSTRIDRALQRVKAIDEQVYRELAFKVKETMQLAQPFTMFYTNYETAKDMGPFAEPSPYMSCRIRSAVVYYNLFNIRFDPILLDRMSNTQMAGLWVHEGVYAMDRHYTHAETSWAARLITSMLFASEPNLDQLAGMIQLHLKKPYYLPSQATSTPATQAIHTE